MRTNADEPEIVVGTIVSTEPVVATATTTRQVGSTNSPLVVPTTGEQVSVAIAYAMVPITKKTWLMVMMIEVIVMVMMMKTIRVIMIRKRIMRMKIRMMRKMTTGMIAMMKLVVVVMEMVMTMVMVMPWVEIRRGMKNRQARL